MLSLEGYLFCDTFCDPSSLLKMSVLWTVLILHLKPLGSSNHK